MKSLDFDEITAEKLKQAQSKIKISLLIDRPHNEMNVGHLFRLADAAGIAHLYLLNPNPNLNWDKIEKKSRKNAKHVPFTIIDEHQTTTDQFQKIIAIEWTDQSRSVFQTPIKDQALLLIVGNEQKGVAPELLKLCHSSVHIPMYGLHSSMNVAMATGIVVYQLLNNIQV